MIDHAYDTLDPIIRTYLCRSDPPTAMVVFPSGGIGLSVEAQLGGEAALMVAGDGESASQSDNMIIRLGHRSG